MSEIRVFAEPIDEVDGVVKYEVHVEISELSYEYRAQGYFTYDSVMTESQRVADATGRKVVVTVDREDTYALKPRKECVYIEAWYEDVCSGSRELDMDMTLSEAISEASELLEEQGGDHVRLTWAFRI